MKIPLGHLVDRYWHRKALLVYLGAALMAARAKTLSYEAMYWISLAIPLISVLGVLATAGMRHRRRPAGALPFLGMFYGLHEWAGAHLGFGARTIAVIDTMADSPLGQVAMIPMLRGSQGRPRETRRPDFCRDGRLHEPGAVGRPARHEIPEQALRGRARPL
jgi:hypothetical protein